MSNVLVGVYSPAGRDSEDIDVVSLLRNSPGLSVTQGEPSGDLAKFLVGAAPDVCLFIAGRDSDTACEAIAQARRAGIEVPVVVIGASADESIARKLLLAGAADYVPHRILSGRILAHVLIRAVQRHTPLSPMLPTGHVSHAGDTVLSTEQAYSQELSRLIASISSVLSNTPVEQIDGAIRQALEAMGTFSGSDLVVIFEMVRDGQSFALTYEWCASGVPATPCPAEPIPAGPFPRWLDAFAKGQPVHVPDVKALLESEPEAYAMMHERGVKSSLELPMLLEGRLLASVGLASVRRTKTWNSDARAMLMRLASHLGEAIHRKRSDERQQLRTRALDAIPNAVMICGRFGEITWVNAAFTRLTGYSLEEVRNANPRILQSGRHDAAFYEALWQTVLSGEVWESDIQNRKKDGTIYAEHMRIEPQTDGEGSVSGFIAVKSDADREARAIELLNEAEERWRLLFESIGEAVSVVDARGVFRYMNAVAAHRLGSSPSAIVGKSLWDIFPAEAAEVQVNIIRGVIQSQSGATGQFPLPVSGQRRWYQVHFEPLFDPRGATVHALVLAIDISDHKHTEFTLRQREAEARHLLERIRRLQEVTGTLSRAASVDELCREAVALGRSKLGFDRIGIWFRDDAGNVMQGAFGTGPDGETCEEREERISITPDSAYARAMAHPQEAIIVDEGLILDNTGRALGRGWSAFAAMWDGDEPIGAVAIDNLTRHQPITTTTKTLLPLFATALGHLVAVRRRTATLAANEGRARALFDNTPIPIYTWRRQGDDFVLCDYNNAGDAITHGGIAQYLGVRMSELYADRPDIMEDAWKCFKEKGVIKREMEYAFQTTGRNRTLSVTYCYVPPDGVLVQTEDISERKEVEDALRLSEERYRTLVEHSPDAIVLVDFASGRFRDANRSAERFFGLSRDELLECTVFDYSPGTQPDGTDSRQAGRRHAAKALTGRPATFRWSHHNASGQEIACQVTMTLLPGASAKTLRASILDLTEQERANSLIEEQRAMMVESARLSSLGVMAGGVAHEINNPLAVISGGIEQLRTLLQDREAGGERVADIVDGIDRNAERIKRIVASLRSLSRDGTRAPCRPNQLQAIIGEVVGLCAARFEAHNIRLDVDLPSHPIRAVCNRTQVSQIAINLLNNAFDAVLELPDKCVRLELDERGGNVLLAVTDSGPKPESHLASRLFEPFFTTKEVGRGMGLGLAVSRNFAEEHGGSLTLDEESANTRFVLRLPMHPPFDTEKTDG